MAESALRPAVIWRNTSFGSQSQAGSEFVARMLTVSSSLKAQGRSLLDFLTESCQAYRLGSVSPSLIPPPQQPVVPRSSFSSPLVQRQSLIFGWVYLKKLVE